MAATLTISVCTSSCVGARTFEPSFPQQSTLDQWFDEAQFESYRKLGYLIGRQLLKTTFNDGHDLEAKLRNCTGFA